jgi:hypothetical protein
MIARVVLLITRLPVHRDTPRQLLTAALGIWWSNVLILASWYGRLDSGGPNARDRRKSHDSRALLFPQWRCQIKTGSLDLFTTLLGVQYKCRVFTNRRSSAIALGEGNDDSSILLSLGTVAVFGARAVNTL